MKAEDEISGQNDCITALRDSLAKLENESEDKIKQLASDYKALSIKHDSLQQVCQTADSDVIELKNKNFQLTAQLKKIINEDLVNVTDLSDQNVQYLP